MSFFHIEHPWTFFAGVMGNLLSFGVFLAPVPTFYNIYKKKSTQSFDSIPYVVALSSSMMWFYFALLTSDTLLMSINSLGFVIEIVYLAMFLIYASKKPRLFTIKLICLVNVGLFGSLCFFTLMFTTGKKRSNIVGWVGSTFAFLVFVAPLSIIRLVIKTKSSKYMPFTLSLFLTLSAIAWFSYGLLSNDYFVALPNVLGFLFGVVQMVLYVVYREKKYEYNDEKLPEHAIEVEQQVEVQESNKEVNQVVEV